MTDRDEMLQDAVHAKATPVHMTSKADVIEYYKDTYGIKGWTRAIATDLYGSIKNRKGENVSIQNIQRRYQGERTTKGEGRSSQLYQQLGKKLPPTSYTPKGNEIKITVTGTADAGKRHGGKRDKTVKVTFEGVKAYEFVNNPNYADIWEKYGVGAEVYEAGTYEFEVESVT